MANKNDVEQWVREGVITQAQADKMLADTKARKDAHRSNQMVTMLSTIGAVSLGIGAVLFVASNWDAMSNIFKLIILFGSTFAATYIGYYVQYVKKSLPRVGASLLFLGTLLFGATLFLVTQMYHINANNDTIVLVWLVGVLPLVYGFRSKPIGVLSIVLFLIWIMLSVTHNAGLLGLIGNVRYLPLLYLVSGVFLFGVGTMHYFSKPLKGIARMYRLTGLRLTALLMFLYTFEGAFAWRKSGASFGAHLDKVSSYFTLLFIGMIIVSLILVVIGLFFNPSQSKTLVIESSFAIGLLALSMLYFFFPASSMIYLLLFNLVFAALIGAMYYVGFHREDITVVNLAMGWTAFFFVAKYFDFFYDLMERSLFFMVGGLILVLGGIALERKRRDIKKEFSH